MKSYFDACVTHLSCVYVHNSRHLICLSFLVPSLLCSPMRLVRLGLSTLACGYPHLDRVGDSEIEDDLAQDLIL